MLADLKRIKRKIERLIRELENQPKQAFFTRGEAARGLGVSTYTLLDAKTQPTLFLPRRIKPVYSEADIEALRKELQARPNRLSDRMSAREAKRRKAGYYSYPEVARAAGMSAYVLSYYQKQKRIPKPMHPNPNDNSYKRYYTRAEAEEIIHWIETNCPNREGDSIGLDALEIPNQTI